MSRHKLLERQIRQHLAGVTLDASLQAFLEAVDAAYRDADADRALVEQTLDVMSEELTERNSQLRRELAERQAGERELQSEKAEQAELISKLEEAHHQLLQSEKLASIGQLAAGVAHEINNPIGFVNSNIGTLKEYLSNLLTIISCFEKEAVGLPAEAQLRWRRVCEELDLSYLKEDSVALLEESADGIRRVRQIVQDLKDFSHVDEGQWSWNDLRKGLDSTLNIVNNEIKYVADVVREYGDIPEIQCLGSQLNQVFLNMLVNSAHAIGKAKRGLITVRTGLGDSDCVFVEISDNGSGMTPEVMKRIFDPFFTTKPVGVGTGLGLSLAYGIVNKHRGRIDVQSTPGEGTTFKIILPIYQPEEVTDQSSH